MLNKSDYEQKALEYAERYGIVDYKVKGNTMIYYVRHPKYLSNAAYTVKHTVYLESCKEITKLLKRNVY